MMLLDSNVVSELMRGPDSDIRNWFADIDIGDVAIPVIAVEETRFGLFSMPAGKRQRLLSERFDSLIVELAIIPFDVMAANACASLRARLRRQGASIELPDAQIAGTALALDAPVAMRNTRHFLRTGVSLVNPWSPA